MPKILTEKEVNKIRGKLEEISIRNIQNILGKGIEPTKLSNGYAASLSIDELREGFEIYHVSVSNWKGETDIKTAQDIADDIIGENNKFAGEMYVKDVFHFYKLKKGTEIEFKDFMNSVKNMQRINMKDLISMIKDMKKAK